MGSKLVGRFEKSTSSRLLLPSGIWYVYVLKICLFKVATAIGNLKLAPCNCLAEKHFTTWPCSLSSNRLICQITSATKHHKHPTSRSWTRAPLDAATSSPPSVASSATNAATRLDLDQTIVGTKSAVGEEPSSRACSAGSARWRWWRARPPGSGRPSRPPSSGTAWR